MGGIYNRKDEQFRLIDVDGVFLASPGDFIIINEPEDFDQASIREVREENHGIDFDFFTEESALIFDNIKFEGQTISGLDLIEQIYAIKGSDLKITFQYRHNTAAVPVIYESELIGSSRQRLDYGVSIRARRIDFDDKFRNRQTIDYDLNRTEDLDGNAITPVVYKDIVLTPQLVQKKANTNKGNQSDTSTPVSSVLFAALNFGAVVESNFDNPVLTHPTTAISFVSAITNPIETNLLQVNRFGFYTVSVNVTYEAQTNANTQLILVVDVLDPFTQTIVASDTINNTNFSSGVTQQVNVVASTDPFQIWANKGHIIRIYIESAVNGIVFITTKQASLELTANTRSSYISTKYVDLINGVEKATEGITGVSNPIISPFLSIQKAALMTGKLIRGFPETETFKVTWEKLREGMRAVFGLGYSVIKRPAGTRVYVDQYSEFYRDVEIASYDNIANFLIDTDKELIANELDIGYQKFSEGSDTVLLNNSNKDFLTKHKYLTPIERDKKKLSYISPLITSGFVIEEGRQQAFERFPNERWKEDDTLFLIALNEQQDTLFKQIITLVDNVIGDDAVIIENYVPHVSSATEITTVAGTFTITSVVPDIDKNRTEIFVSDPLFNATGIISDVTFDITWTAPESDEPFDLINGVIDDKATYNARYKIKNMIFAQSLLLNSGLEFKELTDKYRLSSFDNNAELQTQFSVGENFSTLDPNRVTTTESDDLEKQTVNQGNQLFIPEIVSWELRVSFDEMVYMKNAHEDQLPYTLTVADSTGMSIGNQLDQTTGILAQGTIIEIQGNDVTVNMIDGKFIDGETVEDITTLASSTISSQTSQNYGYVSALSYDGETYQAFLKQREYNLMSEMFKFMGKRKK